jgi:prolipoprotein diacylglyceryltransferase
MANLILLLALVAFFTALFFWSFRNLPAEHWQIIAAVPFKRCDDGTWQGVNLTYYGFFNASACVFSCATILTLMGSIGVPPKATLSITGLLLLICFPAAKLIARLVEGKSSTFTVGGASFVGILLLPLIIWTFNSFANPRFHLAVPITQMLAAAAIAYAFGEAFGRLACISFGCCYGKLLWQAPRSLQKMLRRFCFVFSGKTKKVAYEANLIGRPLIPIQAVTAIISTLAGLIGVFFFLKSNWVTAIMVPLIGTQVWRALSETLRADYRGSGRVSVYQVMAVTAVIYSLAWIVFLDSSLTPSPDVVNGLSTVFNTTVLLFLEMLWLAIFLYMGRSSVTAAKLSFHVVNEKI